jgi:hypothetical protein
MKDLGTIVNDNRNAQRNGALARYRQAIKLLPGGFTMSAFGNVINPSSGYAVAIRSYDTFEKFKDKEPWLFKVPDMWSSANAVGYWKDTEGTQYFEVVLLVDTYEESVMLATDHKQKAFYSFSDKKDIYVS